MNESFALYEGCSFHSTGIEYRESLMAVLKHLGVHVRPIKNWSCCGTSSRLSPSPLLPYALPLKNLAQAEKDGEKEVLVPCAACFSRMKESLHAFREDETIRDAMAAILDYSYRDSLSVLHPLEVLARKEYRAEIEEKVTTKLDGIKIVTYYGCLITRPPKIMMLPDPEKPAMMDKILKKTGAEILDWSYRTECCGASLSLTRKAIVLELCRNIIDDARERGADVIAVACSLCHGNLDMRQSEIASNHKGFQMLPVLYFTQLLGLAMGIPEKALGIRRHMVNAAPLLEKIRKTHQSY